MALWHPDGGSWSRCMARPVKTVALVDLHWAGHHPTSFSLFASALAEQQAIVVPFVPAPEEIPTLLADTPAGRITDIATNFREARLFRMAPYLPIRPRSARRLLQQAATFRRLHRQLREWERTAGEKIDLVFFSTMYDHDFSHASVLSSLLGYDWAGYYVQARCIHSPRAPMPNGGLVPDGRSMFHGRRFRSLAVVDESVVSRLREIVGDRPVVLFPEVTDTRVASDDRDRGFALKIRDFARGRRIVALMGHLRPSKGIEAFTLAARDPRLSHLFFLVCGEANLSGIPLETRMAIGRAWESLPNVYAHLQRIVDERAFNSMIAASDVLYAAYLDFPHSSSILTKAAVFHKPIIVSQGHLMGDQVRRFNLGLTVAQGDVEGVVQAMLKLTAEEPLGAASRRWDDYAALHSYDRLREAFGEILA